jgi:hypothetical protein
MKKITLFGLSALALNLSCGGKKNDTKDADLIAVGKATLKTNVPALDATSTSGATVKFATYDYIDGHVVNETAQTDGEACPNCDFATFETGAKFLFTVDPSKKDFLFFQNHAEYIKKYPNEDAKENFLQAEDITEGTMPEEIRSTPKGFLHPTYVQTYNNGTFSFGLRTVLSVSNQLNSRWDKVQGKYIYSYNQSAGGITKPSTGNGVILKNISATIATVNGQLTNGSVRAWHANSNSGGFVAAKDSYVDQKLLDLGFANTDNFSSRPDSVKIEFAYMPTTEGKVTDKASIEFLFFDNKSVRRLPAQTKGYKNGAKQEYIDVDKNELGYLRFMLQKAGDVSTLSTVIVKAPVHYRNQTDKVTGLLMNISAGDGYDAKVGSTLFVKSIE